MLWPLVLPFKITICLLILFVTLSTAFVPVAKWKRSKTFRISLAFGCIAFIPSCNAIMAILDSQRFGTFQFSSASVVNDFRVERWLPPNAVNITLQKHANGYCAKYSISKANLQSYLDALWNEFGQLSATPPQHRRNGEAVSGEISHPALADTNWPALRNPIEFDSPRERDGGGATYYFDATTDTVHQIAVYW